SEDQTIQAAIAKDLTDYLAERTPIWQAVVDPQTKTNWFTTSYAGSQTAFNYLPGNVTTPLGIALQTVGKSLPQIRKYHANLSPNFYLRGVPGPRWLRNVTLGGALRWEDKGAIGYYGVEKLPAVINNLDKNNPIWDRGHTYVDLLAAYRTKVFAN